MSNMVVNTNVLALNSHRSLKGVGTMQAKSSSRLSSGLKINSAADDAAGLAISEKMRAQVRGLDMASKNSQDAISLIQTAEGGMQEIDNMLQRIRELTVQVSNDTNENNKEGTGDREKMQNEINQLTTEIDSMASRVEFNKKKVINGDYADAVEMSVNATVAFTQASAAVIASSDALVKFTSDATVTSSDLVIAKSDYVAAASAAAAAPTNTGLADTAAAKLSSYKAAAKTDADTLSLKASATVAASDATLAKTNASNVASDAAIAATKQTNTGRPAGLYMQVGANANQGMYITIGAVTTDILGIGDGSGKSTINVLKESGGDITSTLKRLDTALSYVTAERSKLGAAQNRLEYTIKSLDISSENLSAAESRIRDTDMAKEMMNLTKSNVLQQAATSMLAQANQAPQSILQLLQ